MCGQMWSSSERLKVCHLNDGSKEANLAARNAQQDQGKPQT
jgi:hypothetical protein